MKREFLMEVNFTGRMMVVVEAESEEMAEGILFESPVLEFQDTEFVSIEEVEWDMLKNNMRIEELE